MATLRPFHGYRPRPELAAKVAARPYDVLNSDEARIEADGNPISFLHVGKPEIDLPPGTDLYDEQVYRKAKANLDRFVTDGILREDAVPSLYVYAQNMGGHTQYGVVGCVSVQEYLNNTIRKHELTRKDKEDDRTRHVRVTNAHSGPIFLTYRTRSTIDAIVDGVTARPPACDFTADDGIGHTLWVIDAPETVAALVREFAAVDYLYVADGHHRSAAAARVGRDLAESNPHHRGDEEYNYFLAVLFPHTQLRIMDYNRVVKDLHGRTPDQFLEEIRKTVAVTPATTQARPSHKGDVGMYLNGSWYRVRIPDAMLAVNDPVERLDVSIVQKHLLSPVLGIDDPRTSKRIDFVGGIRGLDELERRVNSGEMAVAFAMYPTSLDELLAIADAGKIMPPKSTWFEPKLRDGVVVHMVS